jgi:hypothetical protein
MSLSFISHFRAGNITLMQYIDTKDDAIYYIDDDAPELDKQEYIFKTNSDAHLYNKSKEYIGRFSLFGSNSWSYHGEDGTQIFNLGPNLPEAECFVIANLLKNVVES